MSQYLVISPVKAQYTNLGATSTATSSSFPSGFSADEIAARIVQRVGDRVTGEVSKIVENGVERMTSSAGAGLDRFLDSPAGVALLDKVEDKFDKVLINTVKKRQVELALLGIAATAIVMGGVAVGSKMSPTLTKLSFLIAGISLAVVASGAVSPPEPVPVPVRTIRRG